MTRGFEGRLEENEVNDAAMLSRIVALEKLLERMDYEMQRMYAKLDRLERMQEKGRSRDA